MSQSDFFIIHQKTEGSTDPNGIVLIKLVDFRRQSQVLNL